MNTQTEARQCADYLDGGSQWQYTNILAPMNYRAASELRRLDRIEHAWQMWQDKTEWVQETSDVDELGMHRADALRQRIEKLEAANAELLEALSFYADSTRYHGPNQSLNEPDKWSAHVGLTAYRLDVTRDGGVIASAAIAKHGGTA